ncbi:MAG: Gfo/Idh/MocA family oxidoreductase [Armatimonadota bacterium]
MTNIALLGAGSHSSGNHGPALKYIKDNNPEAVRLVAVCDLDEDKAQTYADRFGFEKTYQDAHTMLDEEDIDGLVLVTPVELTEKLATELLPEGIPLVIEKPPGVNSDAARRLVSVAEETGTPHMVSLNRRFSPALVRAREWIADNAADRPPRVCIARMLRHNRTEDTFRTWTGIHLVDAALSVMGRPEHVHATNIPTEHEDVFYAQAEVHTDLGAVHYFLSSVVGTVEESYEFHGADYDIQVDTWNCGLKIFDANENVLDWQVDEDKPYAYVNGTVGEMQAFIEAIEGRRDFGPTLQDALMSVLTAEALAAGGDTDIVA